MSDLPAGWEWTTLGGACKVVGGSTPRTAVAEYWGGDIPWVTPDDLSRYDGIGIVGGARTLTEAGFRSASVTMLPPGTVLFSSRAPIGYSAIAEESLCTNQGFKSLVPAKGLSSRYLYWYLRHATRLVESLASGTTFKEISKGRMNEVPLALAPSREQERIVAAIEEHLSRIDAAEALLAAAAARIKVLARVSIRELFGSPSWPWTTLGEVAEIKGGVTKDSKRQADPSFVEVPYLRVANVQRGRLDLEKVTTIRVHRDTAEALRLETGDVLLNEGGDRDKLGRGWVWEGQVEDCIHQNHVFRARLRDDFDPYFVSTHANTWGQAWFEEHGRQTTNLASINLGMLKQLPVPAPPRAEQEAIVAELRTSDVATRRLIRSIEQAERRAGSLRRSILAAAFSGQLVPQDANDAPASVLLERIRGERAAVTHPKRRPRAAS